MPRVSIVEAREITRLVKEKYQYDLSVYSLTTLRYLLDQTISRHFLKYPDILLSRLREDDDFLDEFLYDISVSSTEMFRDTSFWKYLVYGLMPEIKPKKAINIWFPGLTSGNDLYSFLIIMDQSSPRLDHRITASSVSKKAISLVSRGVVDNKSLKTGCDNFNEIFPETLLLELLHREKRDYAFPANTRVSFIRQHLFPNPLPEKQKIIFFRNKLLAYHKDFQNQLLELFVETLAPGGFLFIGYQEDISNYFLRDKKLEIFNRKENIYRKPKKVYA